MKFDLNSSVVVKFYHSVIVLWSGVLHPSAYNTADMIFKLNTTVGTVPSLVQYHCRYNLQLLSNAEVTILLILWRVGFLICLNSQLTGTIIFSFEKGLRPPFVLKYGPNLVSMKQKFPLYIFFLYYPLVCFLVLISL